MRRKVTTIQDRRKIRVRNLLIVGVIMLIPFMYGAVCVSGLFLKDFTVENVQDIFVWCLRHPVACINEKTKVCVFAGLLLWLIFVLMQYSKIDNNRIPGLEHGGARWGNIKAFNQKYSDPIVKKNRVLSENIRFRYDASTLRNGNLFVVGGSGAGKTSFLLTPNLLVGYGSNVITDSKGTTLEEFGNYLSVQKDTRVYSLNLIDFDKSMHINPFLYLRKQQDVTKLVANLMQNTDSDKIKNSTADPFWEKSEKMFLESLFLFVWMECPMAVSNESDGEIKVLDKEMRSVLYLLDEAQFRDSDKPTGLDERMEQLEKRSPNHPAVKTYRRYNSAPEDTRRSVLATVNGRMQPFDNEELLEIFSGNDIPLDEFGVGKDGDGVTKSNLFIVIPDEDTTYSFVAGMVYTLLFEQLYYQARLFGGRLPIDVGFWLDEFANIKMPANFERIMATCRSRGIYCVPMLQSLAQMKTLFTEGAWEGVVGNCDTFLYLGGNEASTFEYISKLLGKWTIDKRTSGESKGASGSYNENFDVLGRELMMEYELRLLPEDECILFVRGEEPLRDKKWFPWNHKEYEQARACGAYIKPHNMEQDKEHCRFLTEEALEYQKKMAEKDKHIKIYEIDPFEFMQLDLDKLSEDEDDIVPALSIEQLNEIQKREREEKERMEKNAFIETYEFLPLLDIYASSYLNDTRIQIVKELLKQDASDDVIKSIVHPLLTDEEVIKKKCAYFSMYPLEEKAQ